MIMNLHYLVYLCFSFLSLYSSVQFSQRSDKSSLVKCFQVFSKGGDLKVHDNIKIRSGKKR